MSNRLSLVLAIALAAGACAKNESGSVSQPTPTPAVTGPVLTFQPDVTSPQGETVGLTYGSRSQAPGKIVVSVSGFNIQNQVGSVSGVSSVTGRLRWDNDLLEVDAIGIGDVLGGNAGGSSCGNRLNSQGTYEFCVANPDRSSRMTGNGEFLLIRLQPRTGVLQGTSRIDFEEFEANEGASFTWRTFVLFGPYSPANPVVPPVFGGTITIRPN
ncbi:MAG: hypothetical protein AB7N65_27855 [Vicinamibacterales bacterium]